MGYRKIHVFSIVLLCTLSFGDGLPWFMNPNLNREWYPAVPTISSNDETSESITESAVLSDSTISNDSTDDSNLEYVTTTESSMSDGLSSTTTPVESSTIVNVSVEDAESVIDTVDDVNTGLNDTFPSMATEDPIVETIFETSTEMSTTSTIQPQIDPTPEILEVFEVITDERSSTVNSNPTDMDLLDVSTIPSQIDELDIITTETPMDIYDTFNASVDPTDLSEISPIDGLANSNMKVFDEAIEIQTDDSTETSPNISLIDNLADILTGETSTDNVIDIDLNDILTVDSADTNLTDDLTSQNSDNTVTDNPIDITSGDTLAENLAEENVNDMINLNLADININDTLADTTSNNILTDNETDINSSDKLTLGLIDMEVNDTISDNLTDVSLSETQTDNLTDYILNDTMIDNQDSSIDDTEINIAPNDIQTEENYLTLNKDQVELPIYEHAEIIKSTPQVLTIGSPDYITEDTPIQTESLLYWDSDNRYVNVNEGRYYIPPVYMPEVPIPTTSAPDTMIEPPGNYYPTVPIVFPTVSPDLDYSGSYSLDTMIDSMTVKETPEVDSVPDDTPATDSPIWYYPALVVPTTVSPYANIQIERPTNPPYLFRPPRPFAFPQNSYVNCLPATFRPHQFNRPPVNPISPLVYNNLYTIEEEEETTTTKPLDDEISYEQDDVPTTPAIETVVTYTSDQNLPSDQKEDTILSVPPTADSSLKTLQSKIINSLLHSDPSTVVQHALQNQQLFQQHNQISPQNLQNSHLTLSAVQNPFLHQQTAQLVPPEQAQPQLFMIVPQIIPIGPQGNNMINPYQFWNQPFQLQNPASIEIGSKPVEEDLITASISQMQEASGRSETAKDGYDGEDAIQYDMDSTTPQSVDQNSFEPGQKPIIQFGNVIHNTFRLPY